MKPDILLAGAMLPEIESDLDRAYGMHRAFRPRILPFDGAAAKACARLVRHARRAAGVPVVNPWVQP